MNTKCHITITILLAALAAGCRSATPNHDRAREVGLDYSDTVFDLSLTGERPLGTNETYVIRGIIHPVKKRVALGESFTLSRGDVIYLEGVLSQKDKDHLVLIGAFRGQDSRGRPVEYAVNETIPLGIHCGILYFLDPKKRFTCAVLNNDYLQINKVERKNLPNEVPEDTARKLADPQH